MASDDIPDSFAIGEVIAGKYRVERMLGRGGMGVVVAATHLELGELRAIKFLLSPNEADDNVIERFLREAKAAAQLKSQHVAKVYDVGSRDGAPYMVMEYLDGLPLDTLLAQAGRLPQGEACAMMLQAMEAIDEAHDRGIIHRDLKPANLFLARGVKNRPIVKVLDFGISKFVHPEQGMTLTHTRTFLGSPRYMSPEQMMSARDIDGRADIWSLGVILYEFITGQLPFRGITITQQSVLVVASPTPPPSDLVPDISPTLEAILLRCLEKEPAERYDNVDELITALRPFGTHLPSLPAPVSTPPPAPSHGDDDDAPQVLKQQPPSSGTLRLDDASAPPAVDAPPSAAAISASAASAPHPQPSAPEAPASVIPQHTALLSSAAADSQTAASWGATADETLVPPRRKQRMFIVVAVVGALATGLWALTFSFTNTPQEDAAPALSVPPPGDTPTTNATSSTTHPSPTSAASTQPSATASASATAAPREASSTVATEPLPSRPPTFVPHPRSPPSPLRKSPLRRPPPADPFD